MNDAQWTQQLRELKEALLHNFQDHEERLRHLEEARQEDKIASLTQFSEVKLELNKSTMKSSFVGSLAASMATLVTCVILYFSFIHK